MNELLELFEPVFFIGLSLCLIKSGTFVLCCIRHSLCWNCAKCWQWKWTSYFLAVRTVSCNWDVILIFRCIAPIHSHLVDWRFTTKESSVRPIIRAPTKLYVNIPTYMQRKYSNFNSCVTCRKLLQQLFFSLCLCVEGFRFKEFKIVIFF